MCIKVNELVFDPLDPLHIFGSCHQLYFYKEVDGKSGEKIPGLMLSAKIVKHAMDTLEEEVDKLNAFEDKLLAIKKKSEQLYKNMHENTLIPNTPLSPFFLDPSALKNIQAELKKLHDSESEKFKKIQKDLKKIQDSEMKEFTKIEAKMETMQKTLNYRSTM